MFLISHTVTIHDESPERPYKLTMADYHSGINYHGYDMVEVSDGNETMVFDKSMILEMAKLIMRQRGIDTLYT